MQLAIAAHCVSLSQLLTAVGHELFMIKPSMHIGQLGCCDMGPVAQALVLQAVAQAVLPQRQPEFRRYISKAPFWGWYVSRQHIEQAPNPPDFGHTEPLSATTMGGPASGGGGEPLSFGGAAASFVSPASTGPFPESATGSLASSSAPPSTTVSASGSMPTTARQ
jgi:hypothetical protein